MVRIPSKCVKGNLFQFSIGDAKKKECRKVTAVLVSFNSLLEMHDHVALKTKRDRRVVGFNSLLEMRRQKRRCCDDSISL